MVDDAFWAEQERFARGFLAFAEKNVEDAHELLDLVLSREEDPARERRAREELAIAQELLRSAREGLRALQAEAATSGSPATDPRGGAGRGS